MSSGWDSSSSESSSESGSPTQSDDEKSYSSQSGQESDNLTSPDQQKSSNDQKQKSESDNSTSTDQQKSESDNSTSTDQKKSSSDQEQSSTSDKEEQPYQNDTFAQSQPKILNVPSFPSFDANNIVDANLAKTLPNRNGVRRNTMNPSTFPANSLTPGSSFLKIKMSSSKISFLEEMLKKTDDDNGPISQMWLTKKNRSLTMSMSSAALPSVEQPSTPEDNNGIPPFTYEPGLEYTVPTSNEEFNQQDSQISDFLQQHQNLQSYSWNDPMVKSIDEHDNPFLSPYVDYLKEKDSQSSLNKFQSSIPVQMLSEKVKQIEMGDITYPNREEIQLSRSITYIRDTNKSSEPDDRNPPSVYDSYFISQPPLPPHSHLYQVKQEQISQSKSPFLGLTLKEFSMSPNPLEPFFFTAYLYSAKKFISEEWHFAPDSANQILEDSSKPIEISLNKQGVFELPQYYDSEAKLKTTFVVVAVSHPITIEGNSPVNKYYLKGTGFETNAKLNISKTFPNRNADVMSVFTYSFASLADLLKDALPQENGMKFGQYTFKNFYAINQFSAQKIKDHIQDSIKKKVKDGDYNIKISFDVKSKRALHPSSDFEGYDIIGLTEVPPPATCPSVKLNHKIAIRLEQANFKLPKGVKGRNIYGEVTLNAEDNTDGLKCLHSQLNPPNLSTVGKTRCYYHETKGVFDEVFVFDLPYPIPPKLFIHVNFYHLILKKSNESKTWIGHVCIPIFESPRTFIKDGPHLFTIHYKKGEKGNDPKVDPNNALSFSTLITSLLVPSDTRLCEFYVNVSDTGSLKEADKNVLMTNLYYIIEMLIESLKKSPICACNGLNSLYLRLLDDFNDKIDEYFQIYAQVLAFRNPDVEYHRRLFEGLAGCSTLPPGLYLFLFILIIKSIYLTKDRSFGESYTDFLKSVPDAISRNPTKEAVAEYAKFINLLMDIGCYSASIEGAIAMIYKLMKRQEITLFLYEVFRPKFLYVSILTSDKMISAIFELFRYARCNNEQVFQYMNFAIEPLPIELRKDVATRLLNTLIPISPLEKMPFARFCPNGRVHPVVIYFSFILECMTESDPVHEWFKGIEKPNEFFDSLHFILDITAVDNSSTLGHREITYSVQAAILNSMTIMINVNEQMRDLGFLTYHVLCSNIVADFLPILMTIPTIIASRDISFLFKYYAPPLPKILVNLFKISKNEQNCLVNFINTLFDKDREKYGDTRRSLSLITRSIYQLNIDELNITLDNLKQGINSEEEDETITVQNNGGEEDVHEFYNRGSVKFLCKMINEYIETLNEFNAPDLDVESKSLIYWRQIDIFQYSPDVTIEILNKLSDMNLEEDYIDEAVQAKLLIAAIILEYLTFQNRIKPLFNEFHAALAFQNICSMTSFALFKDNDCPHIIGYCDSPKFNVKSLISLLLNLTKMSFNNKSQMITYEQAIKYIDILWPILESQKSYYYTQRFFKIENTIQTALAKLPPDTDPLFGHYFRIALYGKCFGKEDGKTYIYHEKMLTHLFELSTRLVNKYKSKYPNTQIELIKESGEVDLDKLDKNSGYIQITFVEPFFPKRELLLRTSAYDRAHMIRQFMFDTPFTQGSAAQSTIEHQWIRRTLLTVRNRMPSIFKFEEVTEIVNKNYEPIRVSYRQLHERCTQIQSAISKNDCRNIQQLLHGSLLVMVNEGPSKMAEVFLSNKANLEGDPDKMDKYKEKLKSTFKLFLKVNEEALKLHAAYVEAKPMFTPLQNELEAGFTSLQDKLSKYINVYDEEEDDDDSGSDSSSDNDN